jgi:hypothetical protein
MSLVEATANLGAGYVIAVLTQAIVLPLFGLWMSIGQSLQIGAIFTAVSIVRSFSLRRLFEAIRVRHAERETAARLRAADDRTSEVD